MNVPFWVNELSPKQKMGRNERCWCLSGKKYKNCHEKREQQTGFSHQDYLKATKKSMSEGECLAPTIDGLCRKPAVGSHSLQRSGGLKPISECGHVLTNFLSFVDLKKSNGFPTPKKVGLRQASTFPGFCSEHDRSIFAPIEHREIEIGKASAFIFAYRAVCLEYRRKLVQLRQIDLTRSTDKGRPFDEQVSIQNYLHFYNQGVTRGMDDILREKNEYDFRLLSNNFKDVEFVAVWFNTILPVATAFAFAPEFSFDGAQLQNLLDLNKPQLCTFTMTSYNRQGLILFSWLKSDMDDHCLDFANSFLEIQDSDKASRAVAATFALSENTFLEESWWAALEPSERKTLQTLFLRSGTPNAPVSATDLMVAATLIDGAFPIRTAMSSTCTVV